MKKNDDGCDTPLLNTHLRVSPTGRSPLLRRFASIVRDHADKPACIWDGHMLSYRELDQTSTRLAGEIVAHSKGVTLPVALFLDRSCEVLIGCMAAAKAGFPYVPINLSWPEKRIRNVLSKIGAVIAITPTNHQIPEKLLQGMVVLQADGLHPSQKQCRSDETILQGGGANTPLYILFTSGSTGEPKGVVVTHANVEQFATSPECPGFEAGKRITSCCATAFDLSVAEIWGAMLNGCAMVCSPREAFLDSRRCVAFLQENKLDYAVLPTAVFNALASQDPGIFGSLEKLILCGELPSSTLCKKVRDTAPPKDFFNTYGPTECTVFVTAERIRDIDDTTIIPAGRPLPTASIYVVGPEGSPLPSGEWGEVLIGGEGVTTGYFQDKKRTDEAFIADPTNSKAMAYKTGDRGMLDSQGRLTVCGRFDDQIKVSGIRVELGEIKTFINAAPNVRISHVTHLPPQGLIAYVVMVTQPDKEDEETARNTLRTFLEEHLPAATVPRHIFFVPKLPLTPNGKVDSESLPLPAYHGPEKNGEKTSEVLEAFREALLNDSFSPDDSFLACGGNSLVAAALIGTLHEMTGVWVPLDVFSRPGTARLVQMFIASARYEPVSPGQTTREQVRF